MDTATPSATDDLQQTLEYGAHSPAPWRRWIKWIVLAIAALIVGWLTFGRSGSNETRYVTQEVTRGDLTVTVTATGNLEPRNQVDIGVELSGTVRAVHVDVNDEVRKGDLLAVLDTTRLNAQVLQARSSLASSEARVLQAAASEKEATANYERLLKVRELSNNRIPSQQDLDIAEAAVARARGEAAAAKASVQQANASLETVLTDLSKAEIRSPINGIVLVRSVEPGQTVASSLQAPVLFTLAEDLKKMELHVAVDEADVGTVEAGQQATFTVDAFPNRRFSAHITQVHFASNNTQKSTGSGTAAASVTSTGVVTYETVLEVDNSELLLRPGMTATAEIVTTSITDTLLIPNAALRFTPEGMEFPGAPAATQQRSPLSAIMPMPRRMGFGGQRQQSGNRRMGRAWIVENGAPAMVMFRAGATDGRMTEVLPLPETPEGGPQQMANMPPEIAERMKQAMARKLEPGTAVIVDAEQKKKS